MAKRTAKKTSEWIQLVNKTYRKNKKRGGYTLKNAIQDAKKLYKSSANRISSMVSNNTKKNRTRRGGKVDDESATTAAAATTK